MLRRLLISIAALGLLVGSAVLVRYGAAPVVAQGFNNWSPPAGPPTYPPTGTMFGTYQSSNPTALTNGTMYPPRVDLYGNLQTTPSNGVITQVDLEQVLGQALVTGGQTGSQSVGGTAAAGAAVSTATRPLIVGGSDYAGTPLVQVPKVDNAGNLYAVISPSSATGITSVVSGSAEATHVLKAGAGALYSVYAQNLTSTSGFLAITNTTSAPVDGAITPLDCVVLPGNGFAEINFRPGPTKTYSTGITAVLTSATTCFTKTTGVITGFISGDVQ